MSMILILDILFLLNLNTLQNQINLNKGYHQFFKFLVKRETNIKDLFYSTKKLPNLMLFLVHPKLIIKPVTRCTSAAFHIASGTKRHTFETSRQVLTSIDTTRLTPCCSLFFVNC